MAALAGKKRPPRVVPRVGREDADNLRIVVEATPVAIIVVDERTRIVLANGHAQLLFGYTASELIGNDAELLVPVRLLAGYREMRSDYRLAPGSRPMGSGKKLFGRHKDGRELPVEVGLNPVRAHRHEYILAAIVDITERIRTEERRHGEAQMQLVIDGAANAMIAIDQRGRITLANGQVERLFGYFRQELVDRNVDIGVELSRLTTSRGAFILASIIDTNQRKLDEDLRLANASHSAKLDALSAEKRTVEVSLESSQEEALRQAERLEALWRVANNPTLHGGELVLAMLQQAATAIRVSQRFRGFLGRIEDDTIVVVGVGLAPDDRDPQSALLQIGDRTPIGETTVPSVVRTTCWDDLFALESVPNVATRLGWRAAISTLFEAGGNRYALTFASPEPIHGAFGREDAVYIELLASSFATHLHVDQLTDSLRREETSARQHAARLETLWSLVNDRSMREDELWNAMLYQAAADLRPGQRYRGHLWRVDGSELILEALTAPPNHFSLFPGEVGSTWPLAATAIGRMLAEGIVTRSWDDIQAGDYANAVFRETGTHSFVATTFVAGGATWALSFASTQPTSPALGPSEHAYIEVLSSFFANHVQQRWQFDRIAYQQSHDVLTGLLNRSQFRSQVRTAGAAGPYAIILVDIDAFSDINESYGHMIGDSLLVEVGSALRRRASPDEIVGRLTSDVFGIYVPNVSTREFASGRALVFAETFARSFSTGDRDGNDVVALTACIGIAVAPDDGLRFDNILSHANAALVSAKGRGHGSMVFYAPGMEGEAHRRTKLRNEITAAVAADQFVLYYQPHMEIATGKIAGCEALIRWNHPTRGLLPPSQFIPFAEQTGLIGSIDTWVMRNALTTVNALSAGRPGFRLFFNLSGRQAGDPSLIRGFVEAARAGVRLENLGVEITEGDAMRDFDSTRRVCRALRRLDVRIAIDDFGTGYSSLSCLKRLPVDIVKIDQSFISGLLNDHHDETIIETIISITQHFGFDSLAEGVEQRDEIDWLEQHACRYMQGYLLCHPLPLAEFTAWLQAYDRSSAGHVPRG